MRPGGITAKPIFTISPNCNVQLGPLFLMEKMEAGWHPESKNWRYTMVMPDGTVAGRTHGQNAEAVEFCVGCHASVAEEIGRASCRERVCQYVSISVVAVSLKKKTR